MEQSEGNMSLKNPVKPPGIDPGTVRLVAKRLKHYATPDPVCMYVCMYVHYMDMQSGWVVGWMDGWMDGWKGK